MNGSYFNRQGEPIELLQWAKLLQDKTYQIVKQEYTPNGRYFVSTVWLGLDHNFGFGDKPVFFETMVFDSNRDSVLMRRYTSEANAARGHERLYRQYATKDPARSKIDVVARI